MSKLLLPKYRTRSISLRRNHAQVAYMFFEEKLAFLTIDKFVFSFISTNMKLKIYIKYLRHTEASYTETFLQNLSDIYGEFSSAIS